MCTHKDHFGDFPTEYMVNNTSVHLPVVTLWATRAVKKHSMRTLLSSKLLRFLSYIKQPPRIRKCQVWNAVLSISNQQNQIYFSSFILRFLCYSNVLWLVPRIDPYVLRGKRIWIKQADCPYYWNKDSCFSPSHWLAFSWFSITTSWLHRLKNLGYKKKVRTAIIHRQTHDPVFKFAAIVRSQWSRRTIPFRRSTMVEITTYGCSISSDTFPATYLSTPNDLTSHEWLSLGGCSLTEPRS